MTLNPQDNAAPPNPFSRPGWVVAAIVIGVVLVAGVVLTVMALIKPTADSSVDPSANPSTPQVSETPKPTAAPVGDSKSACGLDEIQMTGTLDSSPQITWAFAGTTAFPVSEQYGPGAIVDGDIRSCFSRTPAGAALAASAGMGHMLDPGSVQAWREYALAPGAVRDEILSSPVAAAPASSPTRIQVTGVRLLSYDGDTALVDVGVTVTGSGEAGYMSSVLPMVWLDGDWRVDFPASAFTEAPAQLPNLVGYVHWKE